MGKTKTKYPVEITIQFIHPVIRESYNQKVVTMKMSSSPLRFIQFEKVYKQFLEQFNIMTPAVLQWISDDNRQQITQDFEIDVGRILDEFGGTFTIIVQSYIQVLIEQINQDIGNIYQEIQFIKDRLNDLPTREEFMAIKKTPIPALTHNQSNIVPIDLPDKKLDLGILFSEPIFDQLRKKPAANPVDFRSQIQRLNTALKSSIKSDINIKCQIATKQNLKHLIKFLQPKILHIICHGTSQGALQFQDDSRTVLGALQIVKTDQIIETLRTCIQTLPEVVFVNSCYSQRVGEAFFQMGVGYVIAIDSQDTIEDQAAQIFSQHFYRNIFSGEKVKQAFIQAKQRVKMKHNSFGCCCRHSSKQKHKKNCRWLQMIRRSSTNQIIDQQQKLQKHKLFHVPSDICKCELKHLNRHKMSCQWARQSLFHINNDFRIHDGDGFRFPKFKSQFPSYLPKDQLVICCCFNYESNEDNSGQFRLPHSQSNKFKIFQNKQKTKSEVVFDITGSAGKQQYKQINDFTAPQLLETHQKIESSIMGRQRQIYQFIKRIKDLNQTVYIVYGPVGVGRTSFVLKCVTYLIQRRVFELYFYIDLYGIKDRDIFRYKFNEITKFNYDGEVKVNQVKSKMMVIILDNADDFFQLQSNQLYDQLKNLRQELHKTKIILTFKEENCSAFDFQRVHSEKYALEPLTIQAATKLIFSKMRHLFDITVQYNQIDSIVRSNDALRIPKFIQSLCQSFSSAKKKIKIGEIKKKLETILEGDMGGNKLIEENLRTLKERSEASYNLLLFMSQFAEGLSFDDFKWLSIYQKKDSKIHLPIGKNWQTVFGKLFEKKYTSDQLERESTQSDSNLTQDSDLPNPSLKNIRSINNYHKQSTIENGKQSQNFISSQSYFLDEISKDRYIVKRFIRDFIWKKHESPQNFYMKHLFVGYMAVMLQIYFKWLVDSKYIHEDLAQYSSVSEAGLFGFKNNVFSTNCSLTQSVRIAREYNSEFQRLISQHPTVIDKIRKSDPSIFVAHHKQDFLNIYEKRWDVVFQYLKEKKTIQDKICIGYLENLMIFIPTAFKIAKVENSLLKYIISKSMSLLERLRKYSQSQYYSQNQKILAIQLKLQLMRASIDLQKIDIQTLKSDLQLNKQPIIKLVKTINDNQVIEYMKKFWTYEKTYMLMYKEYITRKQSVTKSYIEKNKSPNEKLKLMVDSLVIWLGENWKDAEEILTAKRNLIIGLMYLNVLKLYSGGINVHANIVRFKKQYQKRILTLLLHSAQCFKSQDLIKLCLRAKLTYIQIFAGQIITSMKKTPKSDQLGNQNNQFYQDLTEMQKKTQQCENIYIDRRNNLIGFMQFDNEIKHLKKLLKEKFWEISSNTLVCMRPVPLTINGEEPIIQNLVRKKNKFRKEIQKIVNPQIDLCSKFQILTVNKLKEEVQNGCTMLLLTSNVKIYQKRPFLVFQGERMEEDLVEINHQFVQQYDMSKIKICMIVGNNSYQAIRQLSNILEDPPILISLGNTTYNKHDDDFSKDPHDYNKLNLQIFAIEDKRKVEIEFLKMFVKILMETEINSKEQILQICSDCEHIVKGILELRVLSQKRISPIEIKHKKGTYKDLSPGHQKNHNIDMKLKSTDNTMNFICLRRWKDTYRVLQHIRKHEQIAIFNQSNKQMVSNPAVYINVYGDIGSGKSSFVQQMARLFVQRQRYSSGVYIIDGKLMEKRYQGDFENYFTKESQIGKFMTLQDFEQIGNENLMLIIDDFHMIKPRSNGRFNIFLQRIVDKRINLMIVTNNQYNEKIPIQDKKNQKRIFQTMLAIKMQRLQQFEIELIASNILDLRNQKLLEKYEEMKQQNLGDVRVQDIIDLKITFYGKKKHHDLIGWDAKQMKKLQSYRG